MLVIIEGIDGAGKGTQTLLLQSRLLQSGLKVDHLAFPRYGETVFSSTIAEYLNGKFGTVDTVPAEFSALLFAGDRFESRNLLLNLLKLNEIVILDRYVTSNIAYHAARVPDSERVDFVSWLAKIEYEIFAMPKADLTILLDVPPAMGVELVLQKGSREYTESKADIHESRADYMQTCRSIFLHLAATHFSSHWDTIDCTDERGSLFGKRQVARLVWEKVSNFLDLHAKNKITGK